MSWAEVKKINSNLSMPLDELFRNSIRLKATEDDVYQVIDIPDYSNNDSNGDSSIKTAFSKKFKMDCEGTALLYSKANIVVVNHSGGISVDKYELTFYVKKNEQVVKNTSNVLYCPKDKDVSQITLVINEMIGFKKNDEFELLINYNISPNNNLDRLYGCSITTMTHIKAIPYIGGFNLIKEVN